MDKKIEEKHKEIVRIQNAVWGLYREFLADQDMGKYNRGKDELAKGYQDKGDRLLFEFCQNLLIDWSPVMNSFAVDFGIQEGGSDG